MNPLEHFPEPFSPTGNLAAEGVQKQLGRPRKNPLEVFVREALQNCWDARRADAPTVNVRLELRKLPREGLDGVLPAATPQSGREEFLAASTMLLVADRGTTGLGGVLRANQAEDGSARDFVDFMRNIGQPPDTPLGGGTYGYGKVSLYSASACRTVVAYSAALHRGTRQTRFMVARLGPQFDHRGQRYTGRHWWGRIAEDGVIDPVTDGDADALAEVFGLSVFKEGELGTTLAIIDPDFRGLSAEDGMQFIAEAVAWNFWPKLQGVGGAPSMSVAVSNLGEAVPLPDSKSVPQLAAFASAYHLLKNDEGQKDSPFRITQAIECLRPLQHLGRLALVKVPPVSSEPPLEPPAVTRPRGRLHHICLLRTPELVVTYLSGPESPGPIADYAGVFIADEEVDRVFAAAEPPTHDEWVPEGLPDRRHRTFVRVAERRILEAAKDFIEPSVAEAASGEGAPLAVLSRTLGAILPDPSAGPAPTGVPRSQKAARGRAIRPKVRTDAGSLGLDGEMRTLTVPFEVEFEGETPIRLTGDAGILLDSGQLEREPPTGRPRSRVTSWHVPGLDRRPSGPECVISGPYPLRGTVTVSFPADAVVEIRITGVVEDPDR